MTDTMTEHVPSNRLESHQSASDQAIEKQLDATLLINIPITISVEVGRSECVDHLDRARKVDRIVPAGRRGGRSASAGVQGALHTAADI